MLIKIGTMVYMLRNIFVILFFCLSIGLGAYLENIPVTLHQPDDTELNCFSTGDEYYIRLHNEENYTIIQSQLDGYYYFAQFTNDKIIPTIFRADHAIPAGINIEKGVQISKESYLERRNNSGHDRGRDAPTIGTINNINN